MATLSFMEEVRDKASRILPCPYRDEVERCTSELLAVPDYERVMFLCDSANAEENVADVVRAVRRRITCSNGKVQYFTILLLDALIKNCSTPLHVELVEQKGLLRDVVLIAMKEFPQDSQRDAKKAALTLVLNASKWFSNYPSVKCKIFTELPDHIRLHSRDPNIFEAVEVDSTVRLRYAVPLPVEAARSEPRRAPHGPTRGGPPPWVAHAREEASQRHVMAIPVRYPSEEGASAMLDACLVLNECLNELNEQQQGKAEAMGNEIIANVAASVRRDFQLLSMYLAAGAPCPNEEVVRTVVDCQRGVLHRLNSMIHGEISGKVVAEDPRDRVGDRVEHQALTAAPATLRESEPERKHVEQRPPFPPTQLPVLTNTREPSVHPPVNRFRDRRYEEQLGSDDVELTVLQSGPAADERPDESTANLNPLDEIFGPMADTKASELSAPEWNAATKEVEERTRSVSSAQNASATDAQPVDDPSREEGETDDVFDSFLAKRLEAQ